jgi:hypothetical protein
MIDAGSDTEDIGLAVGSNAKPILLAAILTIG